MKIYQLNIPIVIIEGDVSKLGEVQKSGSSEVQSNA
jgi:hypothetical protein